MYRSKKGSPRLLNMLEYRPKIESWTTDKPGSGVKDYDSGWMDVQTFKHAFKSSLFVFFLGFLLCLASLLFSSLFSPLFS